MNSLVIAISICLLIICIFFICLCLVCYLGEGPIDTIDENEEKFSNDSKIDVNSPIHK